MTNKSSIQTENKSLKDVESKDNPASLDQPQPVPADSVPTEGAAATPADVAASVEGVAVEFIHHFNYDTSEGTTSYAPGAKDTLPAHLADQLVVTRRAKYVGKD